MSLGTPNNTTSRVVEGSLLKCQLEERLEAPIEARPLLFKFAHYQQTEFKQILDIYGDFQAARFIVQFQSCNSNR